MITASETYWGFSFVLDFSEWDEGPLAIIALPLLVPTHRMIPSLYLLKDASLLEVVEHRKELKIGRKGSTSGIRAALRSFEYEETHFLHKDVLSKKCGLQLKFFKFNIKSDKVFVYAIMDILYSDRTLYDRFVTTDGMHAVPPPMTGNYIPSGPDIEIDESNLPMVQSKLNLSELILGSTLTLDSCESNTSVETLDCMPEPVVNEPKVVSTPKVWSNAPIIEEVEYDSEMNEGYVRQAGKPIGKTIRGLEVSTDKIWRAVTIVIIVTIANILKLPRQYKELLVLLALLAIPGQTATGKESSNPFMAGSLLKTIHLCDSLQSDEDSFELIELMILCTNFLTMVRDSENLKTTHLIMKKVWVRMHPNSGGLMMQMQRLPTLTRLQMMLETRTTRVQTAKGGR
ncbi:hypothetical protein Tco_0013550 [Tanacetum coccineum]